MGSMMERIVSASENPYELDEEEEEHGAGVDMSSSELARA
jgi:hypothetical protein